MRLQDQQPPEHSPADASITPSTPAEIIAGSEPPKAPAEPAGMGHPNTRRCCEEWDNEALSDQGRRLIIERAADLGQRVR